MTLLRLLAAVTVAAAGTSIVLGLLAACGGSEFTADGAGGAGGEGGGSGSGASAGCGGPEDCPGQDLQCIKRTCEAGVCGVANVTIGQPTEQQYVGDCQLLKCDGQGSTVSEPDDGDVFDDGDECTMDACDAGTPTNVVNVNAPCTTPKNTPGKCIDTGACVQCVVMSDCSGNDVCLHGQCVSPLCVNNETDPGETDENCGGPECPPCDDGKMCLVGKDCVSGVCKQNVCQAPACNDGTQNGKETGMDCGGGTCGACGAGQGCAAPEDCQSQVCIGGICQAPSCNDSVHNGNETDQDCGGSCLGCPLGDACNNDGDCQGHYCSSGVCADRCSNGVLDGLETDQDCGGLMCEPCGVGQMCICESDCDSGVCCILVSGETLTPQCAANASQCNGPDPVCG